jgi:hypothetical protein
VLKEGSWRRTVDSWQGFAQALLGSPWLYVALVLAVAAVLLLRMVKKRRRADREGSSASRIRWVHALVRAEQALLRLGFSRLPGETVGNFLRRLEHEASVPQKGRAQFERALEVLYEYERMRWKRLP